MDFIKKHLLSILCIIAIISLFLPFATVTVEFFGYEESNSASGFDAANEGILGYLLFLAPILLIAMNYIKQLEKHRGILSLTVPATCLLVLIIVFFQARSVATDGADLVDISVSVGFGTILAAVCYIGMGIVGAKTHGSAILKKTGITGVKSIGVKISQAVKNEASSEEKTIPSENSVEASATEMLKKYKILLDDGIITQEEFDAKKKQLLNL